MCKISKEEIQESFGKIAEIDSKEPEISVVLEEVTGPTKCMIDSAKHMINFNKQGFYGTGTGLRNRFNQECELFKFI